MLSSFGSLMDIDKLILWQESVLVCSRFGSLMDIDKLILGPPCCPTVLGFGSLMDIDKPTPKANRSSSL